MAGGLETRLVCGRKASGQVAPLHVEDNGALFVDEWQLGTYYLSGGNADNSLTVPAGYEYQLLYVSLEAFVTTATVGNRQVELAWYNQFGQRLGRVLPGVTQAASLAYSYMFAPSLADLTAARDTTYVMTPLPPTILLREGDSVRLWDNKSINKPQDSMTFVIAYAYRAVG